MFFPINEGILSDEMIDDDSKPGKFKNKSRYCLFLLGKRKKLNYYYI